MEFDKKIFQNNVRFIRKDKSQAAFGESLGISQHTISNYEQGDNPNPTLDNMIRIAQKGKTTVDALLMHDLSDNVFNFGTRKTTAGNYEYSHFEGMTYHVYYPQQSEDDSFYTGFVAFDSEYDKEHLFLHGTVSTGHNYDCKMVIEGTHAFYIYGTEVELPRRFHIAMYYPDFREEIKYRAGLGVLTRVDSREFITAMRVAVTDKDLETDDPEVTEKLKWYLYGKNEEGQVFVNREIDEDFRRWVYGVWG